MYILDTNLVSELMRLDPNHAVRSWVAKRDVSILYLTTISAAELRYGYEIMQSGKTRDRLGKIIETALKIGFKERILSFDGAAANVYAKLAAARRAAGLPVKRFDDLIAAIALSRDMTIVTRNSRDFECPGLRVVDPWNDT